MSSERYTLEILALPDPEGPSAPRRLARGLKYLLRSCRLKCTECREHTPDPSPHSTKPSTKRDVKTGPLTVNQKEKTI